MRDVQLLEGAPTVIEFLSDTLQGRECNRILNILAPKLLSVRRDYARRLYKLARQHLRLAKKTNSSHYWRHCVSRSYYAMYCANRAVRVISSAEFNTRSNDHQLITKLPGDFSNRDYWVGTLPGFRADRNLADYDPDSRPRFLKTPPSSCITYASRFITECEIYLKSKGVPL